MTYLSESTEWRARVVREYVPDLHIDETKAKRLMVDRLAEIHPEYNEWLPLPSQCPRDMLVFCELARRFLSKPDSIYLETGVALGGSLMLAAFSSHPSTKFIGIDLFERWQASTKERVNQTAERWGFRNKLELMQGTLPELAASIPDESVDMLFVDSDHIYETVKGDLAAGWPKVKRGGLLIGHDYEFRLPGCVKAVQEWAEYPNVHVPDGSSMYYVIKD